MLRIINALKALQLYASLHSDAKMTIRVHGDRHIPMNNAYFVLADGKARQTDEPDCEARVIDIAELAEFIFGDEDARMNLMLN